MLTKSDYFSRRILSCLFAIPQREGRVEMRRAKQETNLFFFFFLFKLFLGATGREVQILQRGGVALVLGEVIRHKGPRTADRRNVSGPHVELQTSS